MRQQIADLIGRYRDVGVVVDTNILLLLLVARINFARVEAWSRTRKHFLEEDYERPGELLAPLSQLVATPHILTEASNFANDFGENERKVFRGQFAQTLPRLQEEHVPASVILAMPETLWLGVADAALIHLARNNFLILTVDALLAEYIQRGGRGCINYNHISCTTIPASEWQPKQRKKGTR